ncbi:NAD-dependent epimerase/dehydratase family protein [Clostridium sp. WCA-389-WT-23D1]|uniref:NAD-dependent epimerase/dehydratase family protein n=2 Tax=Clostridiaceae TaxID=31979 RepID=A0A7X2TBC5_9CLOT|nr:NAD-dependent epimerase/dehydratase family protein [Clostridium porci]
MPGREDTMKVLITGAAGLTGAHLIRNCLDNGDTVVGVDNFFRGTKENIEGLLDREDFTFHACDFREYIKKEKEADFDGIYHLAAIVPTRYFYEEPCLTYEVNCQGTYEIFQWALRNHIPRFVNASSSEIYGHGRELPTKETAPSLFDSVDTTTRWSYAHGKIMTEYLLNHHSSEILVCHLRYANVYGPYDVDDNHVIPYILNCIAHDRPCHLNAQAGEIARSFLYMSDCANATRLAMLHMRGGTSYNIGNPEETTILDLYHKAVKVAGELGISYRHSPQFDISRAGDPKRRVLDISRAREQLGYSPKVMLEEGLRRTLQWIVKQKQ